MAPGTVSVALPRQAKFLVAPETLKTYMSGEEDSNGGVYSLVKLWAIVKNLDQPRRMWDDLVGIQEASTDRSYMKKAGDLLHLVVSRYPKWEQGRQ